MTKHSRWNSLAILWTLSLLFCWEREAFADFQYFGSEINYWGKKTGKKSTIPPTANEKAIPKKPEDAPPQEDSFSWKKYLDPKNKEFFKEGDYTPPEPFMEVARDPSDANIKMWFAYIDKKNKLSHRLLARLKEYSEKNQVRLGDSGREIMNAKMAVLPMIEPNAKRYRFRMYFDSHCSHCKRMFQTLSELQARGFYVEARQVDSDPRGLENLPVPALKASAADIRDKNIQGVPLLLVGDIEKKTVYRINGYQTISGIFELIRQSNPKETSM